MNLLLYILAILFAIECQYVTSEKPNLHFGKDGYFKIVQFTDLHFGEGEDEWWGPVQDKNSTRYCLSFQYLKL
jgi:hypothetical protein